MTTTAAEVAKDIKKGDEKADEKEVELKQDMRVAVVGNVDSGKSTLVGVLIGGDLDNGRGLARARVFMHSHESANGRTSCIAQHIIGFDKQGLPVHDQKSTSSSLSKTKSWKAVVDQSQTLVTLIDLAGHEKYVKTTITGLCGCKPHYALVIVNALAGIAKMTREHLGIILALDIPFACVITKIDMAPPNVYERTQNQLIRILKSQHARKLPVHIREQKDVDLCVQQTNAGGGARLCPIFTVSSVTGKNIDLLTAFIGKLVPPPVKTTDQQGLAEFHLEETWLVPGVGLCVSGTVMQGTIYEGMCMKLGPESDGGFCDVTIRSIHYKRVAVPRCTAGLPCALSIKALKRKGKDALKRTAIRRGMVLVDPAVVIKPALQFLAEVRILHHPTTIKVGYQTVIHCGALRQSAAIIHINDKECLRTGDVAQVTFRFINRPECIPTGAPFLFREGSTKGVGKILNAHNPSITPITIVDAKDAKDTKDVKTVVTPLNTATSATAAVGAKEELVKEGVNVDVTGFLCLVSDLTNFVHTEESINNKYPVDSQATERAYQEMKEPALKPVLEFIIGRKLYMCQTAEAATKSLMDMLANDSEKKRAEEWFKKITIVADQVSVRAQPLLATNSHRFHFRRKNAIIFGTGDELGLITLTSNSAFVRSAEQGHNIPFRVFLHAARPLTCIDKGNKGPKIKNNNTSSSSSSSPSITNNTASNTITK